MMSTTPSPPAVLGTTVALAQQALTRRLHALLADVDVDPARYHALRVVALRGPMTSAALDAQLAQAPVPPDAAADATVALVAEGLLALDGDLVALTAAGAQRHAQLSEHITTQTRDLLEALDPDDLQTTIRTLQAATAHADATTAG
jgi:hypothetical protein